MSTIPKNRPVLGKDLDNVRQALGLTSSDALFLFGLSITRWMHVVRRDAELPVIDTSLAILARFIDDNPEIRMMPEFASADEVFANVSRCSKTTEIHQKHFSIMMGAEASAAYRWLKTSSRQSPSVIRLFWHINTALERQTNAKQRDQVIRDWIKMVKVEGKARNVDDIFEVGRWPVIDSKQRVKKPTKAAKKKAE